MSDQNLARKTNTLHEDLYTFMIISRLILLRIFQSKVVQKIKTQTTVFKKKKLQNRAVWYITRKRQQKFTVALPLQKWLSKPATVLCYITLSVAISCGCFMFISQQEEQNSCN